MGEVIKELDTHPKSVKKRFRFIPEIGHMRIVYEEQNALGPHNWRQVAETTIERVIRQKKPSNFSSSKVHALNANGTWTLCGRDSDHIQRWSRVEDDVTCKECRKAMTESENV